MKTTIAIFAAALLSSSHARAGSPDAVEKFSAQDLQTFGVMMIEQHRYDIAEKVARDGISQFPVDPGFHLLLATAHVYQGHALEAFYEYQWEMVQEGPASPTADAAAMNCASLLKSTAPEIRELRRVVEAQQKIESDPVAAVKILDEIERVRGKRVVLELFRAEALQRSGDLGAAALAYSEVIAHAPSLVPAYVELAGVRAKQGDTAESRALLEKANAIDPRSWRLDEARRAAR